MATVKQNSDSAIDNLQHQVDMVQRGDRVFNGYVHRQFDVILKTMATKDDVYSLEDRLRRDMGSGIGRLEVKINKLEIKINKLEGVILRIADKIGASL